MLTPLYLAVLHYIAKRQRDKRYPVGHPLRPYFLPGLWVKFGGAIFIALVYQFYYGGGDTFHYFYHSQVINSALSESFTLWLKLLLRVPFESDPQLYDYITKLYWYRDPASYTIGAIGALLGLLNGTTYLPMALLFAFISYTGIWRMYITFWKLFPNLVKPLALAFLFIPSTVVWGSAIFKDTVCMFGLGWMIYTTFRIFVDKDLSVANLFMLVLSFYLIVVIKPYIMLAFLPALSLWLLLTYSDRIQTTALRLVANLLVLGVIVGGFFLITQVFAAELNKYSLDRLAQTAQNTRGWITYASGDEGSTYDLGDFDPSLLGMVGKLPSAVAVTLYRPFLWESSKPIVLLSALESAFFLCLSLYVLLRVGVRKTIISIFSKPTLLYCLVFTLIFAFAVGITSYNFGALSRYKIPCLPFYAGLLVILYYEHMNEQMRILNVKKKQYPELISI